MPTGVYMRTLESRIIYSIAAKRRWQNPAQRRARSKERTRWWADITSKQREQHRSATSAAMKSSQRVAAHLIRLRHVRPTGIECILREFLLPTLLPRRRILNEHRIKCPREMFNQLTFQVDAYAPALRLVIEADGDYWHSRPDTQTRDYYRNEYLRADGFTVVRFSEREFNAYAIGHDPGLEFWHKIDIIEKLAGAV